MLTKAQRDWLQRVFDVGTNVPDAEENDDEGTADDRRKFEQRFARLHPALDLLDQSIQAKKFSKAQAPVLASVKLYRQARSKVADAAANDRYRRANHAMDALEAAVTQLTSKAGDRLQRDAAENLAYDLRKRYMNRQAELTNKFSALFAANGERPFDQQGQALADAWNDFAAANGQRAGAESRKDFQAAWDALVLQEAAMLLLDPPPGPIDHARARRIALQTQADKLLAGINDGTYAGLGPQVQQFRDARQTRLQSSNSAIARNDPVEAGTELDLLDAAILAFRSAAAGQLGTAASASKSGGLSAAKESLKHDPNALRMLMAQPGGADAIDRMMESMGSKAKSAEDKAFVTAAILARYNMTALRGNLTTKALPRFYEVLGKVPAAQTFGNEKLQFIDRDRTRPDKSSTYGDLTLNLNIGKTGASKEELVQDDDVDANAKLSAHKVNKFDHTTLHELGHSVDDEEKYMDGHGSTDAYGGWQVHKVDAIAEVAGTQKGFYAQYESATMPRGFLRELLKSTLGGVPWAQLSGDPKQLNLTDRVVTVKPTAAAVLAHPALQQAQTDRDRLRKEATGWDRRLAGDLLRDLRGRVQLTDPNFKVVYAALDLILLEEMSARDAVTRVLDQLVVRPATDPPIDYAAMQEHAAVKWCSSVRSQPTEVWERYKEDADALRIGERVYYQDRNNWRSYKASARKKGVSQYQFKAPQEWFAELYAAYHMGTLPDTHPDHHWLDDEFGHQDE
jgi:hypothetical protein